MNKKETATIDIVANDIKWLIDKTESIDEHLQSINGHILDHHDRIGNNTTSINALWRSNSILWKVAIGVLCVIGALSGIGII